jgi:hypothetical protein
MPNVQIKGVPPETHAELHRRADRAGQSLQEYLLGRLIEDASRPSLDELLDRAGRRGGRLTLADAARLQRSERARR